MQFPYPRQTMFIKIFDWNISEVFNLPYVFTVFLMHAFQCYIFGLALLKLILLHSDLPIFLTVFPLLIQSFRAKPNASFLNGPLRCQLIFMYPRFLIFFITIPCLPSSAESLAIKRVNSFVFSFISIHLLTVLFSFSRS